MIGHTDGASSHDDPPWSRKGAVSGAVGSGGVVEDRGCGRQAGSDGLHEKDGDVHPGNGGGGL